MGAITLGVSTPYTPLPLLLQCRDVCSLNASDRCDFIRTNPDCHSEGGYLDYLEGIFCHFPPHLLPLVITFYVRSHPLAAAGQGWWHLLDLTLLSLSASRPPGSLAALLVSDSGSHGGQVVSLALGSGPAYRWEHGVWEVDIWAIPGLGEGWEQRATHWGVFTFCFFPHSFCPNLSAISTMLKLSHNVAVSFCSDSAPWREGQSLGGWLAVRAAAYGPGKAWASWGLCRDTP